MRFNGLNKGDRTHKLDLPYHIRLSISTFLPNLKRGSALNSRGASPNGTEITYFYCFSKRKRKHRKEKTVV